MEAEKHRYVKRKYGEFTKGKADSTIIQERASRLLEQGGHIGDDETWLNY